ncbi:MAG TPA: MAPEG family protein [Hyphomicrobiaceae bacterium]|nr:MAPEG family protein [Hyphomicrobiaceae bacterium]
MPVQITGLYAGLLAIVGLVLVTLVGQQRGRTNISLGDKGDRELIVANRRHMNFIENVPFALLLIGLVELNGGAKWWVHGLGAALLAARIIHPFGLDPDRMMLWPRIIGAGATIIVQLLAALTLLWMFVR